MNTGTEAYDAELERMNAAMSAENMTLLNDNRQLSALIREYEQTLENVMATFRTRAVRLSLPFFPYGEPSTPAQHEVQQRELALMRQYESVLIQRETEALEESLTVNNARSESLARAGRMLRAVMRRLGGEDVRAYEAHLAHQHALAHHARIRDASSSSASSSRPNDAGTGEGGEEVESEGSGRVDKGKERADRQEAEEGEDEPDVDVDRVLEEDDDPEKRLAAAEWALDRECELARLERENEELRALANGLLKPPPSQTGQGHHHPGESSSSLSAPIPIPEHADGEGRGPDGHPSFSTFPRPQSAQQHRLLGGPPGSVGPFGTYKKSTGMRVG